MSETVSGQKKKRFSAMYTFDVTPGSILYNRGSRLFTRKEANREMFFLVDPLAM